MTELSREEMTIRDSANQPSMFANKFHVTITAGHARLVFGQVFTNQEAILAHTSVVLPTSDAIELAKMILKLVEMAKEQSAARDNPDAD